MKRSGILTAAVVMLGCAGGAAATANTGSNASRTMQTIRARGVVRCGITPGAGFAVPDDAGQWQGFDVDFCRAIAVALFNDPTKAEEIPYTQQQRFAGLQSGEVDVLANGTSLTISRVMQQPFHFGPVYFYDGQGFMVPKASKVTHAAQLDGATICVQQGTTTELNLADFGRRTHITLRPLVLEDLRGAISALASGRCDAISQDGAGLATTRATLGDSGAYVILPDRISKEPIAPLVRDGDDRWLEIVNWVFRAPIEAEELGLSRQNVAQFDSSSDPAVRRFLGLDPGATNGYGLDPRWTEHVIAAVGNYGDIFDRHLGPKTPLHMERGLNRLWTNGGLLYSPPFR
jgi:general L-amino acid transport system substrate-binding protein